MREHFQGADANTTGAYNATDVQPSRRSLLTSLAASFSLVSAKPRSVDLIPNAFAFIPSAEAASTRTTTVNIMDCGAKALGKSAPASNYYTSLSKLRSDYPMATALTNEMDWLA